MATWWVFKAVGRRPRADPGQIPTFMVNQVKESSLGGQGQLPRGWGLGEGANLVWSLAPLTHLSPSRRQEGP